MSTETQDVASLIEQLEGFEVCKDGGIYRSISYIPSTTCYGSIRDGVAKLCLSITVHTPSDSVPHIIENYARLRKHLHQAGAKYTRDEKLEKAIIRALGDIMFR